MGRGLSPASKDLIARAHAVLEREHPSGVRRVAYALVGNQAEQWVKKLSKLLTRARKDGLIPWSWIADDSRPERLPYVVEDVEQLRLYGTSIPSFDPWLSQKAVVVVWSEKSVGGTLAPVLDRYLVPFQVQHGHTSTTIIRARAVRTARDPRGRRLVVIWVGDHDASGWDMSERDAPGRLVEYGLDPADFTVTRVAITRRDVDDLEAFRDPVKTSDTRTPAYVRATGLRFGVELEALDSRVLRQRVEDAIRSHITDPAAWDRAMAASEAVRASWETYARAWRPPAIPPLGSE